MTFDVSIPIAAMEDFNQAIQAKLGSEFPQAAVVVLGHMADGNLHVIVGAIPGDAHTTRRIDALVYAEVAKRDGSVSAEHGIGTLKKSYLAYSRTPTELELMRSLKRSLDPAGILNPEKVL